MKKVFLVSLLLISIFLISNAEVASADDCTCYQCTRKYTCGGGIRDGGEESVRICIDEGYAEIGGDCWWCSLGGRSLFSSNKNFVGIGASCGPDLGCSVELRGRSMTVDIYDDYNCMWQLRCVQGGECPVD